MDPERRKTERESAAIAADCRLRGVVYRARLSEVSHFGCCAEMDSASAAPGERVMLQLGRLLVLPAVIRWVSGERAGLEFFNPLHGAMLSQFASRRAASQSRMH
jgi:hypothetical protein